jgi:hypothetical protein
MKLQMRFRILKMLAISVSILFYSLPKASAQLKWENVDTTYGISHTNVHVYALNDTFKGRPFRAFYVEIPLRDKHLQFKTQTGKGKRHTPLNYYKQEGMPMIVMNGTFFSFENNRNLNLVMEDGNVTGESITSIAIKGKDSGFYYPFRSAIGFRKNGKSDVAWIFSDSAKNKVYAIQERNGIIKGMNATPTISQLRKEGLRFSKWKMNTAIGGGPVSQDFHGIYTGWSIATIGC